jgi:hypothetical protein
MNLSQLKTIPLAIYLIAWGSFQSVRGEQIVPLIDESWLNSTATSTGETILYRYHPVMVDGSGAILPWFSSNLGLAYDDALMRTWGWFHRREAETDSRIAGQKHYLFHQVWTAEHDMRGLGGDQIAMFLSSLDLLYNYTGDPAMLAEMRYQADYYLAHSLSPADCLWPNLPFPYNTEKVGVHSDRYDGDMILGADMAQPDKAGSFGWELIKLYKKTGETRYRHAAIRIADTLAARVQAGDAGTSPWPFKVNVFTGKVGSAYTGNLTGTLEMFHALNAMGVGNTAAYKRAILLVSSWLKAFPAATNKWGPFFEDVPGWSDAQINALTYARYLLDHPEFDPGWKTTVPAIFAWAHERLGNKEFAAYQVHVINEQTSYTVPGQSHSSRQAATEIRHWSITGDSTRLRNALRMLNWATYSIDSDGANRYPRDAIWYTDGYGDFWRHLLRAMAAAPQLAPDNANHLLESSSIIRHIAYAPTSIRYSTFDRSAVEVLRLMKKPTTVKADGKALHEVTSKAKKGWMWQPLSCGGVLRIKHTRAADVTIAVPAAS